MIIIKKLLQGHNYQQYIYMCVYICYVQREKLCEVTMQMMTLARTLHHPANASSGVHSLLRALLLPPGAGGKACVPPADGNEETFQSSFSPRSSYFHGAPQLKPCTSVYTLNKFLQRNDSNTNADHELRTAALLVNFLSATQRRFNTVLVQTACLISHCKPKRKRAGDLQASLLP